jgi:hypothetical protein
VRASIELAGAVLDEVTPRTKKSSSAEVKMLSVKQMKRSGKNDESKGRKNVKFRASRLRHFFGACGI